MCNGHSPTDAGFRSCVTVTVTVTIFIIKAVAAGQSQSHRLVYILALGSLTGIISVRLLRSYGPRGPVLSGGGWCPYSTTF